MSMSKETVQGIVRHIITAGGVLLTSYGVIDETVAQAAVGALVTLAGLIWSVMAPEKKAAAEKRAGKF